MSHVMLVVAVVVIAAVVETEPAIASVYSEHAYSVMDLAHTFNNQPSRTQSYTDI